MRCLTMTVGVMPGTNINEAFASASALAMTLNLAWVSFTHNCDDCTAYPDGHGFQMRGCSTVATWTRMDGYREKT